MEKTQGKEKFDNKGQTKRGFKGKPRKRSDTPAKGDYVPSQNPMNDPNWYVVHPELLKDVASFSYAHWLGRGYPASLGQVNFRTPETVVVKLPFNFTFGVSSKSDDPVNLAIRNLYTFVRHQNSGHTNYESADLGMYLLAVGGLIGSMAHVERCLGVAKRYAERNAVIPEDLLAALGVSNVPNFVNNLANYTTRLNILWQRLSSLCIPKDFNFIKRWVWMCSQVFKDHESSKAAYYVFKPISVPIYVPFASGNGGVIQQYNKEGATPDIGDWFTGIESSLNALLIDEDMNIISGDLLKAYGRENLMSFGLTPLDYVVDAVYVEEMLPQIMHAMTGVQTPTNNGYTFNEVHTDIPYEVAAAINDQTSPIYTLAQDADTFTVYQVNGEVVCAPSLTIGNTSAPVIDTSSGTLFWHKFTSTFDVNGITGRILNSYNELPSPEYNMVATRLMIVEENDSRVNYQGNSPVHITACGTEVIPYFEAYCAYQNGSSVNIVPSYLVSDTLLVVGSYQSLSVALQEQLKLSQMDWHPITYNYYCTTGPANFYGLREISGDIDNFTVISKDNIKQLHLTALLGEFTVTQYNLIK